MNWMGKRGKKGYTVEEDEDDGVGMALQEFEENSRNSKEKALWLLQMVMLLLLHIVVAAVDNSTVLVATVCCTVPVACVYNMIILICVTTNMHVLMFLMHYVRGRHVQHTLYVKSHY